MTDVERLWTHEETATYLNVSPWTLTHLIGQGAGPTVFRVGRNRRYDPATVWSWLCLNVVEPNVLGASVGGRHVLAEAADEASGGSLALSLDQDLAVEPGVVAQ